jgi:hypothetical protein
MKISINGTEENDVFIEINSINSEFNFYDVQLEIVKFQNFIRLLGGNITINKTFIQSEEFETPIIYVETGYSDISIHIDSTTYGAVLIYCDDETDSDSDVFFFLFLFSISLLFYYIYFIFIIILLYMYISRR